MQRCKIFPLVWKRHVNSSRRRLAQWSNRANLVGIPLTAAVVIGTPSSPLGRSRPHSDEVLEFAMNAILERAPGVWRRTAQAGQQSGHRDLTGNAGEKEGGHRARVVNPRQAGGPVRS